MGKAIIIPGVSFAGLGMGKVHLTATAMVITAPNIAVGTSCQLEAPILNTVWSIDDDTYASINSSSGLLTIKSAAFGNDVIVTATAPSDSSNTATKTIKLFYDAVDSGQFDECLISDQSSNLRNGSWGNPANAQRIGTNASIGINGYTHCIAKLTKPNVEGYSYYMSINLVTAAAGSVNTNSQLTRKQVCELGPTASGDLILKPLGSIFPLFEDNTFVYYTPAAMTGETPISFGLTFDESNTGLYSGDRVIRIADFTGYPTTLVMLR